eukprot:g2615.t1
MSRRRVRKRPLDWQPSATRSNATKPKEKSGKMRSEQLQRATKIMNPPSSKNSPKKMSPHKLAHLLHQHCATPKIFFAPLFTHCMCSEMISGECRFGEYLVNLERPLKPLVASISRLEKVVKFSAGDDLEDDTALNNNRRINSTTAALHNLKKVKAHLSTKPPVQGKSGFIAFHLNIIDMLESVLTIILALPKKIQRRKSAVAQRFIPTPPNAVFDEIETVNSTNPLGIPKRRSSQLYVAGGGAMRRLSMPNVQSSTVTEDSEMNMNDGILDADDLGLGVFSTNNVKIVIFGFMETFLLYIFSIYNRITLHQQGGYDWTGTTLRRKSIYRGEILRLTMLIMKFIDYLEHLGSRFNHLYPCDREQMSLLCVMALNFLSWNKLQFEEHLDAEKLINDSKRILRSFKNVSCCDQCVSHINLQNSFLQAWVLHSEEKYADAISHYRELLDNVLMVEHHSVEELDKGNCTMIAVLLYNYSIALLMTEKSPQEAITYIIRAERYALMAEKATPKGRRRTIATLRKLIQRQKRSVVEGRVAYYDVPMDDNDGETNNEEVKLETKRREQKTNPFVLFNVDSNISRTKRISRKRRKRQNNSRAYSNIKSRIENKQRNIDADSFNNTLTQIKALKKNIQKEANAVTKNSMLAYDVIKTTATSNNNRSTSLTVTKLRKKDIARDKAIMNNLIASVEEDMEQRKQNNKFFYNISPPKEVAMDQEDKGDDKKKMRKKVVRRMKTYVKAPVSTSIIGEPEIEKQQKRDKGFLALLLASAARDRVKRQQAKERKKEIQFEKGVEKKIESVYISEISENLVTETIDRVIVKTVPLVIEHMITRTVDIVEDFVIKNLWFSATDSIFLLDTELMKKVRSALIITRAAKKHLFRNTCQFILKLKRQRRAANLIRAFWKSCKFLHRMRRVLRKTRHENRVVRLSMLQARIRNSLRIKVKMRAHHEAVRRRLHGSKPIGPETHAKHLSRTLSSFVAMKSRHMRHLVTRAKTARNTVQLRNLQSLTERLQQENDTLRNAGEDLQKENRRLHEVEKKLLTVNAQVEEKVVKEQASVIKSLKHDKQELFDTTKRVKAENERLKEEISAAHKAVERAHLEVDEAREESRTAKKEKEMAIEAAAKTLSKKGKLEDLEKLEEEMEKRVEHLREEEDQLKHQVSDLRESNTDLEKHKKELEKRTQSVQMHLDDLQKMENELEDIDKHHQHHHHRHGHHRRRKDHHKMNIVEKAEHARREDEKKSAEQIAKQNMWSGDDWYKSHGFAFVDEAEGFNVHLQAFLGKQMLLVKDRRLLKEMEEEELEELKQEEEEEEDLDTLLAALVDEFSEINGRAPTEKELEDMIDQHY